MKLYSAAFEKALQQGVADAVRSNPELEKEFRRSDQRTRRPWMGGTLRFLAAFLLAALVWRITEEPHPVDSALMVINLWILTMVVNFARGLVSMPFASMDITALRFLPVAESRIFDWEFYKFSRGYLFCLGDLTAGLATLALILHLSPMQWIMILFLVPVTGAFMLTLAMFGAARFFLIPFDSISGCLYLLWSVVFVGAKYTGPWVLPFIHRAGPTFNILMPTGWPLSLFHLLLPAGQWSMLSLILPIGLILWTYKDSVRLLRSRFVYQEPIFEMSPELVPSEDSIESLPTDTSAQSLQRSIGATAIEEGILSGGFLSREEWHQGWLERRLWRWFDRREKTIAEFVFPTEPVLTKAWKGILRLFVIVSLVGFAAGLVSSVIEGWVLGIGLFIIGFHTMYSVFNAGNAFSVAFNNGTKIPMYAAYPITFRELSRTLFKYSAIQMPLVFLLLIASLVLLTHLSGLGIGMDILIAINASFVFWGIRYFLLVFGFSSGTNDSCRVSLRSLILFTFFALFGFSSLILAVLFFLFVIVGSASGILPELQLVLWIFAVPTLLIAYLFYRIYGWYYNSCRFDLIRPPR